MTSSHDPELTRPTVASAEPVGDADLEQAVRAVADSWTMPPVRLDGPAWRDRIRTPRERRLASLRAGVSRLGRATVAAVTLSVGAAVVGVMLTRSPGPATSPSQSPTGSRAAATPAPSTLPKLVVNGPVPAPSQLVVGVDNAYAIVNLADGSIGPAFASGQYGTVLRRGPNGSLYCLCLGGDSYTSGSFSHMTVTWNRYADDGTLVESTPVADFTGAPDPRDAGNPEQSQHVALRVTYDTDSPLAFVGWSFHAHPTWKSGLVLVNVDDGTVVQRIDLPDRSDGADLVRFGVDAPRIVGSLGPGHLAIVRPWYEWSPPTGSNPSFRTGADSFDAADDGSSLANVVPLDASSGCADAVTAAGRRTAGGYWLACTGDQYGTTIVRRVGADGQVLGDTQVTGHGDFGGDAGTAAISPDGTALFLWNPLTSILTRVDLTTGDLVAGTGTTAAGLDPLRSLGTWLTPPVQAKVLLSAGLALSPDGARAYALGVDPNADGVGGPISTGIFVFDTATMAQVDHWTSMTDLVSIAVSADGAFVYVAGSPEFNGNGSVTLQSASITVYEAGTGATRLLAGQLGKALLLLPSTTVR